MLRRRLIVGVGLLGLATQACGDDYTPGRFSIIEVTTSVTAENKVQVDILYSNDSDEKYDKSRCIFVGWYRGQVITQEQARAGMAETGEQLEEHRWCNGGNKVLQARDRDQFRSISGYTQAELAGSTIVIVAEEFRGKPSDDRRLVASP